MNHPIKLSQGRTLDIAPSPKVGGVVATLAFQMFGITSTESMHLTPENAWRAIVKLEQALPPGERHHTKALQFEASAG